MCRSSKKVRERSILRLIYDGRSIAATSDSERPDFLLQCEAGAQSFGVEVAEFYHSQTAARLDRISGYSGDLLDHRSFRHKYDRKALSVDEVSIVNPDG